MTTLQLKNWVSSKLNELVGDSTAPPVPPSNMIFCDAHANYIYSIVKDTHLVSKVTPPATLMMFLMSGQPSAKAPRKQTSAAVVPLSVVGTATSKASASTASEDETKSDGDNGKDSDEAKTTPGEDTVTPGEETATAATPDEETATAATPGEETATPGEDTASATESKDDGSASSVATPTTTTTANSNGDAETKSSTESASTADTTTTSTTTTATAATATSTSTATTTPIPAQPHVHPVALMYQKETHLHTYSFCHYPSMLSILPGMTHRELYSVVRQLVQRLVTTPKEGEEGETPTMPFKLVAVYRDSRFVFSRVCLFYLCKCSRNGIGARSWCCCVWLSIRMRRCE